MKDFVLIMPEIFLALTLVFVVAGEITYHRERTRLVSATALIGLFGALIQAVIAYQHPPAQAFSRSLSIDGFSLFFRLLFIVAGMLSIATAVHNREIPQSRRSEYCALIVASTLAMCLAASASDLLVAFLSIQAVNIFAFFIAAYSKHSITSTEAGVKQMVFSVVSGALLLYGFAILFGATQSLNIYDIHRTLVSNPIPYEATLVVFMLIFLALSSQMAAFPMHLWAPDVLEGSPTPGSAFLGLGLRAMAFAVGIRFILVLFAQPAAAPAAGQWQVLGALDWTQIVSLIAGLTMAVGPLLAFQQVKAKRLVGCLVVGQTGFLLMGLLVLDEIGVGALLFNLVVETFAVIGIYYVLSFYYDELQSDRLTDLKGMLNRAVPESICLVLCLACLVGLPPTPGFLGKFSLIGIAAQHHRYALALVATGAIVLSTAAIARLSFSLLGELGAPPVRIIAPRIQRRAFLAVILLPVVLLGVFAETVFTWAGKSLGFILW